MTAKFASNTKPNQFVRRQHSEPLSQTTQSASTTKQKYRNQPPEFISQKTQKQSYKRVFKFKLKNLASPVILFDNFV